jgi:D-tyrosyl-tRNA(Tyr) deacylase
MRAVIQRVTRAEVRVDGAVVGSIGEGYLVLLGVEQGDGDTEADALAAKTAKLRLSLCGDVRKGNRPSFVSAAEPAQAERLYERYCDKLRGLGVPVETGRFGAMMEVDLVNDGPVTIIL